MFVVVCEVVGHVSRQSRHPFLSRSWRPTEVEISLPADLIDSLHSPFQKHHHHNNEFLACCVYVSEARACKAAVAAAHSHSDRDSIYPGTGCPSASRRSEEVQVVAGLQQPRGGWPCCHEHHRLAPRSPAICSERQGRDAAQAAGASKLLARLASGLRTVGDLGQS